MPGNRRAARARSDGLRENWNAGSYAYYEYHCYRGHDSADAQLWYRSHKKVKIVRRCKESDGNWGTIGERAEEGTPAVYDIVFADGWKSAAYEDELFTSRRFLTKRLGPPKDAAARLVRYSAKIAR